MHRRIESDVIGMKINRATATASYAFKVRRIGGLNRVVTLQPGTMVTENFALTFPDAQSSMIAPEVKAGEPYGFSSDVWQIGYLAYQLATVPNHTGLPPQFQKIEDGEEEPKWLNWVPENIQFLILAMLR